MPICDTAEPMFKILISSVLLKTPAVPFSK
jgi:hypothetical protein